MKLEPDEKKKTSFNFTFEFQKVFRYYSLFSGKLIPIKGPEGEKSIWSLYLGVSVLVRWSVSPWPRSLIF